MRVPAIDRRHDLPTRLTFRLLRRVSGVDAPEVLRVTAYRHRYFGSPYLALVQDLMRGPSSWSEGERELFAAFTSARNQCRFCTTCHEDFAGALEGHDVVAAALADPAAAGLRPEVAAVLTFLGTMADTPDELTADDARAVRAAGVDDVALEQAVRISTCFHVINRVLDVAGAAPLEGKALAVTRHNVMKWGYGLPPTIKYLSPGR